MFGAVVKPGDPDHPASVEDLAERLLTAKRFLLSRGVLCRQVYAVDVGSIAFVSTSGIAKTALLAIDEDSGCVIVETEILGWPAE